jgi:hypothetical protein
MGRGSRGSGHYDPEEDYEYEDERRPRRRPHPPSSRSYRRYSYPQHRRRVWPLLLAGCGMGILFTVAAAAVVVFLAFRSSQSHPLGSSHTFTQEDSVQVPISSIAQMQICNKIGNVMVQVDPGARATTVMTKKIVHMSSQSDADQEFKRIMVAVQPPATINDALTCTKPAITPTSAAPNAIAASNASSNALTVNVTMPDGNGMMNTTSDAVDIVIKIPQNALPADGPTMLLNVEAPVGDITIDGLSGILNVKGSTGNVSIKHAILANGSRIETGQGNITFNGLITVPPGSTAPTRYFIQDEQGNIDVTLPANTNITVDANTNVGAIHSEFAVPVNNNGGPVNYHGPLDPAASNVSPAVLVLDVSTGDVNIHKAAS